jgi:hypothetical protein
VTNIQNPEKIKPDDADLTARRAATRAVLEEAAWHCEVLGPGAAAAFADGVLEFTIHTLKRNPCMPPLSYDEWWLLLADLRQRLQEHAAGFVGGMVDLDDYQQAILMELEEQAA